MTAQTTGKPKSKGGKRKLSVLSGVAQFQVSRTTNATAVEDKIAAEIAKFEALKLTAGTDDKYKKNGFFDMLAFYNDYQNVLPIHTLVVTLSLTPT